MSTRSSYTKTLAAFPIALVCLSHPAPAGTEIEAAGKDKIVKPLESQMPPAMITLGGKFSDRLTSGYVDSLMPFWAPGDSLFFLNSRTTTDDSHQTVNSIGLGWRYLIPDHEVIIGANGYYDAIHSVWGNDYDQLGLGAEVLTRWVDARFNYYRPEDTKHEVDRTSRESVDRRNGAIFTTSQGNLLFTQQPIFTTKEKSTTRRNESAIGGWNAEVGFLVPGLDEYMELRVFAGMYGYSDRFNNYVGFKARAEARFLPGLIADVEYWDDAYLTGGHWTGELRVSVPFSLFNLASGRNPFEGTAEMFRPRKREFRERLTDMVIRSHRVDTNTDSSTTQSTDNTTNTQLLNVSLLQPPAVKKAVAPPVDGGEGG